MIRQSAALRLALYLLAAGVVLTLALFLGARPGQSLRPADDPARTALVNARLHLSMSLSHERQLVDQAKAAHHELETALDLLAQAKQADPQIQAQIDALRIQVGTLADDARMERLTPSQLGTAYRDLSDRIESLIQPR